jgi:hypothetical protein
VVGGAPADPDYRATAAECHRSLGYYFSAFRPADAERQFDAALRLADGVYADRPDPESRALLASVLGAYGQHLVQARRLAEAEKLLDRGAALVDPKAGPPPPGGRARLHYDQASQSVRYALALTYAMTRRADRAEQLVREVIRDFEAVVAGQPKVFPYRLQTANAYAFLAALHATARRPAEAAAASGRGLEIFDGLFRDYPAFRERPRGVWLQQLRQTLAAGHARNLLDIGSAAEAARFAADLDPTLPGSAGVPAYNVGCLFALLAGTADGSTRDEYVAKAMTWLKQAAAGGYPATAADVEHVRTKDDDLKVLRGRPEFQEWARDLKPAKGK